jgi:hypothetical protein
VTRCVTSRAVIGRGLGLAVQAVPEEVFGPLGSTFAADQPSSSAHPQEALGCSRGIQAFSQTRRTSTLISSYRTYIR